MYGSMPTTLSPQRLYEAIKAVDDLSMRSTEKAIKDLVDRKGSS